MNTADIIQRLEKLEKSAGVGRAGGARICFEDIRETEILIYGDQTIKAIESDEGRDSLKSLAQSPEISETVREMIVKHLNNKTEKGEFQNENSKQERH